MSVNVPIKTLFLILSLIVTPLLGCSVSEDTGTSSSSNPSSVQLAIATTNGATTLMADGSSSVPIQITVLNGSGQGVPNTPVTFTTTAGTLAVTSGTTAARTAADHGSLATTRAETTSTVLTNSDGMAEVTLTSSTAVETATVTAQAMGFSTAISVDFISGVPNDVALSAIPSTVGVGSTTTVRAVVTDADGATVEGVSVTFSFTANNSGGSLSTTSGTTDVNGVASVTYTAGSALGTDSIKGQVSSSISDTVTITVQTVTVDAASLELLVSSPQLDSDNSESVILTALVRNSSNNFVTGATVSFSADSGGIQVVSDTTDDAGKATALLFTAGDPTNRTITVTATAGTLTSTNTVNVTGTTVALSGTSALVLGETTTLSILLRDSGDNGIANQTVTLSSELGNTLSNTTVTTDTNGQATFQVTANVSGSDTITATALSASGDLSLTISSANFVFSSPTSGVEVNLSAVQTITVHWDEAGVNQAGQTINFFATRGTLSASSATTNANGNASVTITSTNAGPAAITAVATSANGPSSQLEIEFIATTPTSLILQANPTSVGVNTAGTSDQQSIITAIVRDTNGNLVKNQTVSFMLIDVSGGSIFPASAITDSFGRASTVYTAGAAASAQDGVIVDAQVAGTVGCTPTDTIPSGPCDRVTLTVSQKPLSVTLGTSNLIAAESDTQYAKPYSVLVTDANGSPVANATVELSIYPTRYQKGFYALFYDEFGLCIGWGKFLTVSASSDVPNADNADKACDNEDVNRNGLLNPGEDVNNNGTLESGNIATAPASVTTDSSGFALFNVVYAKEFTWVEIELEARTSVAGSEGASTARFFLPGLASDFNDCDISPPGDVSPYGVANTCGCDELADGTCPTGALASVSITVVAGSVSLPSGANTVTFTMTGGTETSYSVTTTAGTLTNLTTTQAGSTIQVNFGQNFTLATTAAQDNTTITLTAIDQTTGQSGKVTVTQD